MEPLLQDVRFALRSLRKHRSTTIIATLCLALGIGANTAIYSVVRAVVLDGLPYRDPQQLFAITETYLSRGVRGTNGSVSPDNFKDWRTQSRAFVDMAAYGNGSVDLEGTGEPERLRGIRATANVFAVLGATALRGRVFTTHDDAPETQPVVVISEGLWRRRFGASASVIGSTVELSGTRSTVIGVMPAQFDFPISALRNDVWELYPQSMLDGMPGRGNHSLRVVGRVRDGVDSTAAAVDLARITSRIAQDYPQSQKDRGALAVSLSANVVGKVRPALMLLLGAVGVVLLIACANVANLLLARATARRREIAIRTAIGGARGRIIRQLLTESVVLAITGGVLGLGIAWVSLHSLVAAAATSLPRAADVQIDGGVLLFAMFVSLATGVLFGLAPALQASRADLRQDLSDSAGRSSSGRRQHRTLNALIVGEIALSLVLLVGAGLTIRAFVSVLAISPGFNPDGVLAFHAAAPAGAPGDTMRYEQFYGPLLARLRVLPGVRSAAFTSDLPMQDGMHDSFFFIEGRPKGTDQGQFPDAETRTVSSDYFRAMGIPIVAGREFNDGDTRATPEAIVINDELAKRFFAGQNPLGQRIDPGDGSLGTIVGVVGSVHQLGLEQAPHAEFYRAAAQDWRHLGTMTFVLSGRSDPDSYTAPVRAIMHDLAPQQPMFSVATMTSILGNTLATRRLMLVLLSIFAGLALTLSAAGVYGVMSYGVSQRTQEIGIRMALGASAGVVAIMVLRDAGRIIGTGVLIGLLGAAALTRLLQSALYGVGTHDPLTFVVVPLVIGGAAFLASAMPAIRAARVDPVRAMTVQT
ncbi:MAG TPA: ABC transporter permease [Gemmatimonadaceae bacterium]|jgi:predicted permease